MKASGNYNPITQSGGGALEVNKTDYREGRKNTIFYGVIVLVVLGVIAFVIWYVWTNTIGQLTKGVSDTTKTITSVVQPFTSGINTIVSGSSDVTKTITKMLSPPDDTDQSIGTNVISAIGNPFIGVPTFLNDVFGYAQTKTPPVDNE